VTVLADTLAEAATRFADRAALVFGDTTFTYAMLVARADEVAAGYAALGVERGHVVGLVLPTSADYVVAYLALSRIGAVVAGVNTRASARERDAMLATLQPDHVIDGEELPRRSQPPPPPHRTEPDDPETIVFTSGTTGTPKGALFTARQVAAITEIDSGGVWGAGGPQVIATGLPHIGFMTKLAGHLKLGNTLHLLARWRAEDALRIIARERIEYVAGVAAQISLLMKVPDFDRYDLSAVKGLIVGAGPSPAALVREAKARFGAGYSIRYSSTESGGLGTLTAFDAPDSELETVGRPRPGTELEIRSSDTGAVLPTGEVGQICLRSPAVMAGYWRDPDATRDALDEHGWLRTGDLGCIRDDGCLRITGRRSDMFIRGGYNVFPLEVESVLLEHPAVAAAAVVPRPSDVMGEIGVAVVVPRDPTAPPALDDLRAFAADRLAHYKLPEALRIVDALPLTGMDKVDRRALIDDEAARAG
jgi:acyl-CoA synthetase (AMP-forming)/AMP-acid ligase II